MSEVNLLCEEKHKSIDEKIDTHERILTAHSEQLVELKTTQIRTETIVQNLCDQIKSLVDTMRTERIEAQERQNKINALVLGCAGTTIVILIGFFIWYIQSLPR
jgi:hypothetical protein